MQRHRIPWPQYYQGGGWDSPFSSSWGINTLPALFVVDQNGNLFSTRARPLRRLEQILEELLAR